MFKPICMFYDIDFCSANEFTLEFDQNLLTEIQHATNNLTPYSFSSYDLHLSSLDIEILDSIAINDPFEIINFADIESLPKDINSFLQYIGIEQPSTASEYVAHLITNITKTIISASPFSHAYVKLRSELHNDSIRKFCQDCNNDNYAPRPDWHIDKSFSEILHDEFEFFKDTQHNYIFTLIGNSTLYLDIDENTYKQFLNQAHESSFTINHDNNNLNNLTKTLTAIAPISVERGYGTVHFAGKKHGTIHSAPILHDRLLVIIVPHYLETIENYHQELFADF